MTEKLTFCENCRDDVSYNESEIPMTGKLKDVDYHYVSKEAYCERYGNPVYVHEINDYNLEKLYAEYHKIKE